MVGGLVAWLVCWLAGRLIGCWLVGSGWSVGLGVGARASCSSGLDSLGFPNGESGMVVMISITTLAALASSQVCLLGRRKARFRIQLEEGAPPAQQQHQQQHQQQSLCTSTSTAGHGPSRNSLLLIADWPVNTRGCDTAGRLNHGFGVMVTVVAIVVIRRLKRCTFLFLVK